MFKRYSLVESIVSAKYPIESLLFDEGYLKKVHLKQNEPLYTGETLEEKLKPNKNYSKESIIIPLEIKDTLKAFDGFKKNKNSEGGNIF